MVLEYGVIRCGTSKELFPRIEKLTKELKERVDQYNPDVAVLEQVFFAKNAKSALVLGQARGAILSVLSGRELQLIELSPKEIKLSVTGTGSADKDQVAMMMQKHLSLLELPTPSDAADALAMAWVGASKKGNLF